MGASLKIWTHYSTDHIESASYFARSCWKIEDSHKAKAIDKDLEIQHRAFVTGCVFASVAFLEATINELFASAAEAPKKSGHIGQLPAETQKLMGSLWSFENFARRARALEKFQSALKLADKPLFETGSNPYQDSESLILLRNALIHYEPEWILANPGKADQADLHKLEQRLKGKFSPNPFAREARPFFPQQCLGHGCAEWATKSSIEFAEVFYERMGMTNPFSEIRPRLATT